jgi:hypothetical protein
MIDPLAPAARLRRTLRLMAGVRLGPHGHGNPNVGIAGPTIGNHPGGSLLPGGYEQTAPATPEAIQLSRTLRDLSIQRQMADPAKVGAINTELQNAVGSLSQLLRPRRRGGKVRATAVGGKPAASVGGRPYVP